MDDLEKPNCECHDPILEGDIPSLLSELRRVKARVIQLEADDDTDQLVWEKQDAELTRLREENERLLEAAYQNAERISDALQTLVDEIREDIQADRNALQPQTEKVTKMPVLPMRDGDLEPSQTEKED